MSTETFPCDVCCTPFIEVGCCPNPIPPTLKATIIHNSDDGPGDCSAWNGASGTLVFDETDSRWKGSVVPGCGEIMDLEFYCGAMGSDCNDFLIDWLIRPTCTSPASATGVSPDDPPQCTCDPVFAEFSIGFDSSGCLCCTDDTTNTSMTIVITE